ncbi:hypothetical protein KIW84_062286 [Lathyrus oleraceus]|uniref:Uncharacterized protein n=1 Tax=Pisum sativum TaxID=3888 RepID=A0A9D5A5E0_PEA|nr:hypothetical protein KIW84_062286 [Pisum sativum]
MCLSCLVHNLLSACASIFRRGKALSTSSSLHKTTSMTSAASLDNSLSDMCRSPPRPLPYDAEPLNSAHKWNECAREDELKIYRSKSASRASISKTYTWSWACSHQVHSSTSGNAMDLSSDVHGLPEASVSNAEIKPNNSPYHTGVEHVHAAYLKPAGFVSKQEK